MEYLETKAIPGGRWVIEGGEYDGLIISAESAINGAGLVARRPPPDREVVVLEPYELRRMLPPEHPAIRETAGLTRVAIEAQKADGAALATILRDGRRRW